MLVLPSKEEQLYRGHSAAVSALAVGVEFLHDVLGEVSEFFTGEPAESLGLGFKGFESEAVSSSHPQCFDCRNVQSAVQLWNWSL
jgi:hypothetical protein